MAHEKLKEALHHVIARCDNPARLGAIRLNKIMLFADRFSYRLHGATITADGYIKKRLGPVPKSVRAAIQELAAEQKILVKEMPAPGDRIMRHFYSLTEANTSALSENDRSILDMVSRVIIDNFSAMEISDVTHDAVWEAAEMNEDLPMYTVFARSGDISERVRAWGEAAVKERNLEARLV